MPSEQAALTWVILEKKNDQIIFIPSKHMSTMFNYMHRQLLSKKKSDLSIKAVK